MAASEFLEDIKELLDGLDVQEQVDFPIELDELERGPTDFVSLTGRKIRGRGGKGILFRSYDPIRLANARKAAASRKMTERGDEPPTKTSRLTSGLVNEGRCKKNEEFFCLDCEGCCDLDCQHLLHPRKIIGRDLVLHYRQTQHTRVQPVNNFVMTKLGHVVRTEDPGI